MKHCYIYWIQSLKKKNLFQQFRKFHHTYTYTPPFRHTHTHWCRAEDEWSIFGFWALFDATANCCFFFFICVFWVIYIIIRVKSLIVCVAIFLFLSAAIFNPQIIQPNMYSSDEVGNKSFFFSFHFDYWKRSSA